MTRSADINPRFVPFARGDTEQSIVERFRQQAHRYPAHPAIESLYESLTYSELDSQSNRLANLLLAHNEGKMSQGPVALLFGHNPSMVIAMLGVLKAGKSYLPLDLRWPVTRLKEVLTHSQSRLLLTEDACEEIAKEAMRPLPAVLNTSRLPEEISKSEPDVVIPPDQLAYILYTSGSTGPPKGVMQSHRNVLCNIRNYTNDIHLAPSDRLSLLTSFSFAASVSDLYGGLMNGATVCLFDLQHGTPQSCVQWLHQKHITIFYSVPSVFRLLGSVIDETVDLSALRVLKLGGDSVTYADYQIYRDRCPDSCLLLVSLGATELNLICRNFIDKQSRVLPGILSVGYPPEDVELALLDDNGNALHDGAIGQLMVRSPHLALGYWNDSEEHECRLGFDSCRMNQRVFHTGDLGRFQEDGGLIHLGRSDARVKIHGQAVSLKEIEAVLTGAPMVREAVVVTRLDSEHHTHLVAYVVGNNGGHPPAEALRRFLSRRLPGYMVPGDFIFLNDLPLNSNGKIDRRQLPPSSQYLPQKDGYSLAPRNHLEVQLTAIWEKVLEKKPIGVTDNFFHLGGESLVALRLSSEIERMTRRKTTPSEIFHAQTIEALANLIGEGKKADPDSFLVPIQSVGSHPPLFCLLFGSNFKRYLANYPDQPVYMFFNQGHDGRPARCRSVEEIAARYLKELRAVQPNGPYHLAGYSFGGVVAFEMAHQLLREGECLDLLALVDPITLLPQSASRAGRNSPDRESTTTRPVEGCGGAPFKARLLKILGRIVPAIQWRTQYLKHRSWNTVKKGVCGLFFRFGRPLPTSFRRFYSGFVTQQAAREYLPRTYPGKLVVFQTRDLVGRYWSNLCTEVVKAHNLPCKHLDIYVDGPHVPDLLGQLVGHLEEARRNRE